MKQTRKLLALLLGLALALSLLPAAALAEEEDSTGEETATTLDVVMRLYEHPLFGLSERISSNPEPFDDLDGLTPEQKNAFGVLRDAEVVTGHPDRNGNLLVDPMEPLTRVRAAVFISRVAGPASSEEPVPLPYKDIEAWAYEPVQNLYAWGVLTDEDMDEDGNFRSEDPVSMADLDRWMDAFLATDPDIDIPKKSITAFSAQELAVELKGLGLFQGSGELPDGSPNFDLDSAPSRIQAVIMMIRVLGQEQAALSGSWSHPYQDVADWADAYVGYAQEKSLAGGISGTEFAPNNTATVNMYLTYVLRALGYSDAGEDADFAWDDPYDLAEEVGILPVTVNQKEFLRGDMVIVSAAALSANLKDSEQTLAEKLMEDGVFTEEQYSASALSGVTKPDERPFVPVTVVEVEAGEFVTNLVTVGDMTLYAVYRDDDTAKPVVIVIHGGGGSKEATLPEARDLAGQGFYALAIDAAACGDNTSGPLDAVKCWATTVTQLDAVLDYFTAVPQADTEHFGITGGSMGGTITFGYVAHGKYTPAVITPSLGSPDYTLIYDGPLYDYFGDGPDAVHMTQEEIQAFAAEYSPLNTPERFLDTYIYAGIGTEDPTASPDGLRSLENALQELGGTKFIFNYYEGYGHEDLPGFDSHAALRQILLGTDDAIFDLD